MNCASAADGEVHSVVGPFWGNSDGQAPHTRQLRAIGATPKPHPGVDDAAAMRHMAYRPGMQRTMSVERDGIDPSDRIDQIKSNIESGALGPGFEAEKPPTGRSANDQLLPFIGQIAAPDCGRSFVCYSHNMKDGYRGDPNNRMGCLAGAVVGVVALFFDFGRNFGDPAPGTEELWWRLIPFPLPTLVFVAAAFLLARFMFRRNRSD